MRISRRQSGSSLLLILLIASAASVVILAGAKLLLDSARSSASASTKNSALAMAEAGIQDGLLLYKTGAISAEYGEDASAGDNEDLQPMRRGFVSGTDCLSLGDDEPASNATSYDTDCPFYDLTIRRFKEISYNENSTDPANHFYLSTRVFPHDTEVMLQNPGAQQLIIQFTIGTTTGSFAPGSQFKRCTDLACNSASWSDITNDLIDVQPADVAIVVKMKYDANLLQSHVDEFAEVKLSGTGKIRFDRGYTTIVSRGYAGRTKQTKLVNVYPARGWDLLWPANPAFLPTTPSYAQVDFSDCFNENGQQVGLSAVSAQTCY